VNLLVNRGLPAIVKSTFYNQHLKWAVKAGGRRLRRNAAKAIVSKEFGQWIGWRESERKRDVVK